MSTKNHGEDSNSPSSSGTKKRGKRGVTKKPSYMAEGQFFCGVCESPNPTGYHYGKITCEGCKGFFKRVVQVSRGSSLKCRNNGQCIQEGRKGLRKCASCRYSKCLQIGMDPELVKVGSILVAWNQKKQDNRKRRETLQRSHCDSSEETSMCMDSSNEESINSGSRSLNLSGLEIEHRTPQSSRRSVRLESSLDLSGSFHTDPGVNAFLHFTGFSSGRKIPDVGMSGDFQSSVVGRSCDPIETIIKNFKKILGPREKSRCHCEGRKDAEEMLRNCVYRTSWTDFFLAFDELCELDDDVINDTVLESVTACQAFITIATGLMPGGKTLKLESDSQVMVIPEKFMEDPSFSVFQSMLLAARTSVVMSLTTLDVAVIMMLTAVNFGKEIATRRNRLKSLQQLEQIDATINNYINNNKPNDPQTYQVYQDLITVCIIISCQIESILA